MVRVRLMERDLKLISFLESYGMPMTNLSISKLFYSQNNNLTSSIVIANRRLLKLCQGGYIEKMPPKYQERNVFYIGTRPNEKQLKHKIVQTDFLAELYLHGFKILDLKFEYTLPEKYGIRCDMMVKVEYNHKTAFLFVECDLTKDINPRYQTLFKDIEKGLFKSKHNLIFVSLSNRRITDEQLRKQFVQLDTNLKTFDSLIWKFLV